MLLSEGFTVTPLAFLKNHGTLALSAVFDNGHRVYEYFDCQTCFGTPHRLPFWGKNKTCSLWKGVGGTSNDSHIYSIIRWLTTKLRMQDSLFLPKCVKRIRQSSRAISHVPASCLPPLSRLKAAKRFVASTFVQESEPLEASSFPPPPTHHVSSWCLNRIWFLIEGRRLSCCYRAFSSAAGELKMALHN